jgi:branched-chain amino acid transport system ATP-binding protein
MDHARRRRQPGEDVSVEQRCLIPRGAAMTDDLILETQNLTKEFEGFVAVNNVNLKVRRGTIHALIGPNGAGKTTVFNLISRLLVPSRGRILYNGHDITRTHPALLARRGLARSFQISAIFPHLTALENVRIALQSQLSVSFRFWRSEASLQVLDDRAMQHLAALGLDSFAGRTASELPYGRKRALELATTLALDPKILLLDEPASGLSHEDIARITKLIQTVARGRSVLMVEHNLSVVANLCDIITVLQRGEILAEGIYDEVSRNEKVAEAYLGTGHELKPANPAIS